jgi:hypothetical protein
MAREIFSYYEKEPLDNLILLAIFRVLDKKEICSFERLLKECFNLFPNAFSFETERKWPDSRKLDRELRRLRNRNFIKGEPKTFFFLTKNGKKAAEEAVKKFRQGRLKI